MSLSESEIRQLEMLKKKTPQERFLLMANLIQGQIEALKAGCKHAHPEMGDEELHQCLRAKLKEMHFSKH